MRKIFQVAMLLLGLSIIISCNKDAPSGKSLVGKWQFTHFEWTTTSGEVIKETLDATIYWTFTDKMLTIQEKTGSGEDSGTCSYTYEDGVLIINTFSKTMISEGTLFNVEKLNKTELVMFEPDFVSPDYPIGVNGQSIYAVKGAVVFKRVN